MHLYAAVRLGTTGLEGSNGLMTFHGEEPITIFGCRGAYRSVMEQNTKIQIFKMLQTDQDRSYLESKQQWNTNSEM